MITDHIDDIHLHRLGNLLDNNHFVCTGPLSPVGIAVFAIHAVDGDNREGGQDKLTPWIRQGLAKWNIVDLSCWPLGEGEEMASIVQTFNSTVPLACYGSGTSNGPEIRSATDLLPGVSPRSSATSDSLVDEAQHCLLMS